MNKLIHLKMTKQFLRKVVKYRRDLQRFGHGKKVTTTMVSTMQHVEYLVAGIDSFDRMLEYISRREVQQQVIELIPSNKRAAWVTELEHLVIEGKILAGQLTKQYEIDF